MSIASIVTRGRGFGGIPALVTHGFITSDSPPTPTPSTGGVGDWEYLFPKSLYEKKQEVKKLDAAIDLAKAEKKAAEEQRLLAEKEKNKKALKRLSILESKLQEEINRLLEGKAALIRLITDEEECLIVLYSMPFIH